MEIKSFPKDMSALELDKGELKRCLLSGLFEEEVEINGEKRGFYTYLTPGLTYDQRCVVVAPPDGVPIPEYLGNSFWTEFADKHRIFLIPASMPTRSISPGPSTRRARSTRRKLPRSG